MSPNPGDGDFLKETNLLLPIPEPGEKQIRDGKFRLAADVLKDLRKRNKLT